LYPFISTETKQILRVPAEKMVASFCCIASAINMFIKAGLIVFIGYGLIKEYTDKEKSVLLDDEDGHKSIDDSI